MPFEEDFKRTSHALGRFFDAEEVFSAVRFRDKIGKPDVVRSDEQRGLNALSTQKFDHARVGVDDRKRFVFFNAAENGLIRVVKLAEIVKLGGGEQRRAETIQNGWRQQRDERENAPLRIRPHAEDVTGVCLGCLPPFGVRATREPFHDVRLVGQIDQDKPLGG